MSLNLKQLIGKLNDDSRRSMEAAAGLCLSRTNYNIEIEHWLLKLLDLPQSELMSIIKTFGISVDRLTADLTKSIDKLKTGNARPPALSKNVVDLIREAWLGSSIEFLDQVIRTGHLVYALVADEGLNRQISSVTAEFDKVSAEELKKQYHAITHDASEAGAPAAAAASASGAGATGGAPGPRPGGGRTPSLDQYTIDLTGRAAAGQIDPVLGRDSEIRQVMDILCRRRQNNPILTGEPGVGKTAIAEGFALRIAARDVPPSLQNVSLRTLDLGLLQAGAGMKGEFENRLKAVIEEVKASPQPIILFIDEAHTLIGAGGSAGQGDAANLLKPALARGELRTIAATTWAEYKKYFERDAALARRFQVVKVEEPTEDSAVAMMRGLIGTLEKHHGVEILSDAVEDAVRLSKRYISGRLLPDKAVSLLDTTGARINLALNSTPSAIEDCQRQLEQNDVSLKILEREARTGADHTERLAKLAEDRTAITARLTQLQEQLDKERELVAKIRELRAPAEENGQPNQEGAAAVDPANLGAELKKLEAELRTIQGETPLMHPYVDSQAIAETIESWTGIPVGRMVADEVQTVLQLRSLMEDSIVGQSHALELISQSIRTSRAKLTDPRMPIGVFLLVGTSGVGKTETAITLANLLYGGEQNMTVINMSEFKEEHKVSLLMGSPPGYVGYGEGGVLTEAVRRKPYSVVLLDEMEKAHPGVQDIFYQVFDKGQMKDGEGRDIDFRNTIILMTSNAGTDLIKSLCADPDTMPNVEGFTEAVFPELLKTFKPAFLGRCTIVPYYPLSDDVLKRIIRLKLGKIGQRIRENYRAAVSFSDEMVEAIAARCTEVDTGARNIDHILRRTLLPELSSEFLARMGAGDPISQVTVSSGADGKFLYTIG
ncbi:MAG: type VI secretion system ATPase TssH [Planctomyces sp.]|nr:type VI secretion system ATPase TssH [Planctomyces sp.]